MIHMFNHHHRLSKVYLYTKSFYHPFFPLVVGGEHLRTTISDQFARSLVGEKIRRILTSSTDNI